MTTTSKILLFPLLLLFFTTSLQASATTSGTRMGQLIEFMDGHSANQLHKAMTKLPPLPAISSYRNGFVQVTQLMSGQGSSKKHFGHEIRMNRKDGRIKAKYFASGNAYAKYAQWKRGKDIVLVCAGAFSDYSRPTGLTVDNGVIVNRKLDESMDALVVVYATGGMVVSDLDNRFLQINIDGKNKQLDLRDAFDLRTFLEWAKTQKATVFQTQLLAFKSELQIDEMAARTELASRRFLVLGQDQFGDLYHTIVNINESVYLGPASKDVFYYMEEIKQTDVIGMINLDTGMYDIMEFYNDAGSKVPSLHGEENVSKATNLVAYYYE